MISDDLDPPRNPAPDTLEGTDPNEGKFTPEILDKTVIAIPLLRRMETEAIERRKAEEEGRDPLPEASYDIIIDVNLDFLQGRDEARQRIRDLVEEEVRKHPGEGRGYHEAKSRASRQYVFATLGAESIRALVRLDTGRAEGSRVQRAIHRIWPDFEIRGLINRSLSTVKADAARVSFSALGEGIVWAVLDSGIQGDHPHFKQHQTLEPGLAVSHFDFTRPDGDEKTALVDEFGHGTHVAGIIAGELDAARLGRPIRAVSRHRDEHGEITYDADDLASISGMAARCKLVSMKVLDASGRGKASNLIAALEQIQEINGYGRRLRIHGVNMSVGYDFEPEWFACGQSPLCVEADRLVRSGVVVVVAAGNTGYGFQKTAFRETVAAGMQLSINDPGNAELAITVGSTHRDMPHVYGVSYFSSKGPTGDGRIKPDLVAPGEKIVSCAAGAKLTEFRARSHARNPGAPDPDYLEQSGTSMAAPHVSGVIAAFISVRREFIGQPERVKEIFLDTATDLRRDHYFQGRGLVDLMRAIQSI